MKLGAYLDREKITLRDFGERIGVNEGTVSRYVSGERTPRPDTMVEITRATGGAVTANDFMPDRCAPSPIEPTRAA